LVAESVWLSGQTFVNYAANRERASISGLPSLSMVEEPILLDPLLIVVIRDELADGSFLYV
jgi:hypothetical protein